MLVTPILLLLVIILLPLAVGRRVLESPFLSGLILAVFNTLALVVSGYIGFVTAMFVGFTGGYGKWDPDLVSALVTGSMFSIPIVTLIALNCVWRGHSRRLRAEAPVLQVFE